MYHPTPWHFWPVLAIAFVWHLVGVIDYTATQFEFAFWMAMVSDRQEAFIDGMPNWIDGSWAVAVWAGLLGVVLMAFRIGFAPLILAISFIATVIVTIWLLVFSEPSLLEIAGWTGFGIMIGASAVGCLLWLYARAMHKDGVID